MIQMNIHGRLGNQMFQYAFMRAIMKKNNIKELQLNFSKEVYSRNFSNDLSYFNIIKYKEMEKINLSIYQKILLVGVILTEKIMGKIMPRKKFLIKQNKFELKMSNFLSKRGIYYLQMGYANFKKSKFKNQYCNGCFESPKFFDNIKNEIMHEFTPKYEKLKKNKVMYDLIDKTNSVCITIRRGDFLSKENIKNHYVCTPEYFEMAIKKIMELIENPTFFVFSDDIEWVKKNMKFPNNVYFECGNDPVWEKLRLMYSCKHFIISNSTFSWWAQYLSRNTKKIVIAPSRWKNSYQNQDIYCDDWILINPEGE